MYSVKSAYRLCMEDLVDTSHLHKPGFWSGIWKLKVPPKIKNLIWRMCRGCLPTRVRLQDKGVQCSLHYVSCDHPLENLIHVFFSCPFAQQVWRLAGLWAAVYHAMMTNVAASGVVFSLVQNLGSDLRHRMVTIIWSLWKHRNNKLWQNENETAVVVVDCARKLLSEWMDANTAAGSARHPSGSHASVHTGSAIPHVQAPSIRWQRPQLGRLKCNINAAFASTVNRTGLGAVSVMLMAHMCCPALGVLRQ